MIRRCVVAILLFDATWLGLGWLFGGRPEANAHPVESWGYRNELEHKMVDILIRGGGK